MPAASARPEQGPQRLQDGNDGEDTAGGAAKRGCKQSPPDAGGFQLGAETLGFHVGAVTLGLKDDAAADGVQALLVTLSVVLTFCATLLSDGILAESDMYATRDFYSI